MSLSAASMKTSIKSAIKSKVTFANESDDSLDNFCEALADAIVTRIQADLTVSVPVSSVVVASAPPAPGVMNVTPISCTVA